MTHRDTGSRLTSIGLVVLAVLLTSLPLHRWLHLTMAHGFHWGHTLMMAPFILAGVIMLFSAFNMLLARRVITLRQEEVEKDEISLTGRKHWKEPIKRYLGIRSKILMVGSGTRTEYELVLEHGDPQKNIILFRSNSWLYLDDHLRGFSKLLKVPSIEQTPQGIVRRSPREWDQPIRFGNQYREILWVEPESLTLSKKAAVKREGTGYIISFSRWAELRLSIVSALLSVGVFGVAYHLMNTEQPVSLAIVGLISLLLSVRVVILSGSSETVFVSSCGIESRIRYPWGQKLKHQLPIQLVTDICIKSNPATPLLPSFLTVSAGKNAIRFGCSITQQDKDTLRCFLITVLSNTALAAAGHVEKNRI